MAKKDKKKPARTLEGRENELISLAVDLAEEKLRNGTASSQIITTLLNLATVKNKLEMARLNADVKYKEAKIEEIKNAEEIKELYSNAIAAMQQYQGVDNDDEDDYYYDE